MMSSVKNLSFFAIHVKLDERKLDYLYNIALSQQ